MNILLLGSGGREHALAWKLARSHHLCHLTIAPGNAGTELLGDNIPVSPTDFQTIKQICLDRHINMVVVGPEDPLVHGISDFFAEDPKIRHIHIIGPDKFAARLEGSKSFAKDFMIRYGIPTAPFRTFTHDSIQDAFDCLKTFKTPYVIKADGLAAGKGVVICRDETAAISELNAMLHHAKFGEASQKVVIEQFLSGIELSVFIISDGTHYKILPEAKDYKKIGEGDTGLNTGGMGSVSPVSFCTPEFLHRVEEKIIRRTMKGLKSEHIPYKGFLFFGLMNVGGDPYVIEYNCRMGDPEAESVIPRIQNDLVEVFMALAENRLDQIDISVDPRFCTSVMLVSEGYPGSYVKGKKIYGLSEPSESILFHAGTTTGTEATEVLTNGGRVLSVTSLGNTMEEALNKSYSRAATIGFEGKYYRNDIGFDL